MVNDVPIGNFWSKVLRIGPNPKYEGAQFPDVEFYYLAVQCQHCENPNCVEVCPTEASHKLPDGTVQIDKSKCTGCQFCAMACSYGVRYLNEEERVVEKCALCEQQIAQGELPQCVKNCVGMAKWFGDFDSTPIRDFEGATDHYGNRFKLGDCVRPFEDSDVRALPNAGNNPSFRNILRNLDWKGGE